MPRRTKPIKIGSITIGGDNPVAVQSMTKTKTRDVKQTLAQIYQLQDAGCELVRVAVATPQDAEALSFIKSMIKIPLIADVHFNPDLALMAIQHNADKIRINPGNIGNPQKVTEIIRSAKDKAVAIRIGVNSGSLERDLLDKYKHPCAEALVESALRWIEFFEKEKFFDIVVSIKSTDVTTTVESNRLLAQKCSYPIHLGLTEAGPPEYGIIKTTSALAPLLLEGIGDTIRVSLTADPVLEVKAAYDILRATGVRFTSPEIIACPTCGRIEVDLEKLVNSIKEKIKGINSPVKIAVLGCAVNGPGEAREADIGIAGGKSEGLIFVKGKIVRKVKEDSLVEAFMEELNKILQISDK